MNKDQHESFQSEYSSINQAKPAFMSRIPFKLESQINISKQRDTASDK